MVLFICCAPFHIFSAINLALTDFSAEEKDIYITDHSEGNYQCYLELKKSNIFNRVCFIKSKSINGGKSRIKWVRYIKSATHFLYSNEITNQINDSNKKYDCVMISSPDIVSEIIYYHYKKIAEDTKLYMYDEGTFAYNYFSYKMNIFKRIFTKLIYGRDIMNEHAGAYVYRPEFIETDKPLEINKLKLLDRKNPEMLRLLNSILGYKSSYSEVLNTRFIYFDQAFLFEQIVIDGIKLLELITKQVDSANIKVKLHPRTSKSLYNEICEVTNVPVSYETINLNYNINNKVLISIFSTACLNPKIIFDEEPFVILLFKLVDLTSLSLLTEKSFSIGYKVKYSYSNPNRFFIPESIEELKQALEIINSEIDMKHNDGGINYATSNLGR